MCFYFFFFFFKQKTAYEMRISDWSSDVCSSDLLKLTAHIAHNHKLLVVLLAKNRNTGLYTGKQLHDHRADAVEKAGAEFAFQYPAQVRRRLNPEVLGLGVHFALVRRKQHIDIALALDRKSTRLNSSH